MNIVDRLTGTHETGSPRNLEEYTRRDVLYSRLRSLGHAPENINLDEVDFTISDNDLRLQVAKARGITSETAIAEIDLDEITIPSGAVGRRARRVQARAVATKRRKATHRWRRNQHKARIAQASKPSGHEKVVAQRAAKAQQDAVAALIKDGVDPRAAYEQVVGVNA